VPRLLICRECKTIDLLPTQWETDDPRDPLLDTVVRRHVQKHGDTREDCAALLSIKDEDWEGHKDEILANLRERWTGFHPEFYATKDTFVEDAGKCYNQHGRPKGADCIDFCDDSKRLTPSDWQTGHVYLCHFCVVSSAVTTAIRMKKGMYDKEPFEVD
jgi:hypothetical protein